MKKKLQFLLFRPRVLGLLFLFFFIPFFAFSQKQLWVNKNKYADLPIGERRIAPDKYQLYELDTIAFKTKLWSAPHESDVAVQDSELILSLPTADGDFESFRIVAYDMMEVPLQAVWHFARTWRGISTKNPLTTIRLDWTARGFHAMVFESGNTWAIDPYLWNDNRYYQVHKKKDYPASPEPFLCQTDEEESNFENIEMATTMNGLAKAGDCQLRSYRLALACTGEYATFHGGTVAGAASAMVTTMNRCNGVYEKDLAIRLIIIGNNNNLIYLNGSTDPYTNNSSSAMLSENRTNCDNVIGSANYDIGHVFSTGGGGVAYLRSVCSTNLKGGGVTGRGAPVGDFFDIDYVCHEMGHQFGGNHTQNNNCNRTSASMEPGSASSIMGYAGICSPNVQSHSDDYYHAVNIVEIANYMELGSGDNCSALVNIANSNPDVSAGLDYSIPTSTPFVLTATATDPNGHPLTYCWEQYDNEVGAEMPPLPTNVQGPMFRTFDPVASPKRYFPRLQDLVNNVDPMWEELPSVARSMDFMATVRNNNGTYGCTDEDLMSVDVQGGAGPFLVTSPNTNVTWSEGTSVPITWDVAGTTAAPISCSDVDILLSYDGGLSYPVTLASQTANDGTENIIVPVGTSSTARVMVICSDNVFFDISNQNFTINQALVPDYIVTYNGGVKNYCLTSNSTVDVTISTSSLAGFSNPISFALDNPPAGVSATYAPSSTLSPGASINISINGLESFTAGNHNINFIASSTSGNKNISIPIEVIEPLAAIALAAPADQATDQALQMTYFWNTTPDAVAYLLEVSTQSDFSSVMESVNTQNNTHTISTILEAETDYYWRVTAIGSQCGLGLPSSIRSFTTESCLLLNGTNLPITVNNNEMESEINIARSGNVTDVDVLGINMTHTWVGDMTFSLEGPDGTTVELFSSMCGSSDNINLSIDSDSGNVVNCPLNNGQKSRPENQSLTAFNNKQLNGIWKLIFSDDDAADPGTLNAWSLRVCSNNLGALPVEWLAFNAILQKEDVLLNWSTAIEENNAGFEIQRKAIYEKDFRPIGWLDASTTPSVQNNYQYLDKNVEAGLTYYYRLRQLDYSGEESYSEIRSVRLEGEPEHFIVYPNPVSDRIYIQPVEQGYENTSFLLFDTRGRLLWQQQAVVEGQLSIDVSAYAAGVYNLLIQGNQYTKSHRIVIKP